MNPFLKPVALMLFLLSVVSFNSYSQKKKPAKKSTSSVSPRRPGNNQANTTNDNIKNGIQFKSKGFVVSEAYLFYDDESPVPAGNKVRLNQNVNLLLIIDSGWNEVEGRVYPGSSQIVNLNTGAEILVTEDLFQAFDEEGVATNDARYITLNTTITELVDKKHHCIVNFRVWDKKGTGEITGSYKLFIK
jgi:hypothetical protein